jgi:hypothetical protein
MIGMELKRSNRILGLNHLITFLVMLTLLSCNRSGEIKVQNNISRTTIENIYWGQIYVGGSLRPGQETEFFEIKRSDTKLPAEHRIFFSVEGDLPIQYYTVEKFELDKKGQLIVALSDSTEFYEVE